MKIQIEKEGEKRELEVKKPKYRLVQMFWNTLERLQGDEEDIKGISAYNRCLSKIGREITGLSEEEYGELETEEVAKISNFIYECGRETLGFTKPSPTVENSSERANIGLSSQPQEKAGTGINTEKV